MMPTCKWITDHTGPLACRNGQHSHAWSICPSAADCPARRNQHWNSRPELGARLHRDVPAAGAQPGRRRNPVPGPAAENRVLTGLARPCYLPPSFSVGS